MNLSAKLPFSFFHLSNYMNYTSTSILCNVQYILYNYVLCPCRVLSAIAFAAIKVEYSFSSNNIIWCIFIQTFRFPLTSVKKGDVFGFGIRGDWESEFHAGPHCRLYFTLNGTEVWTVRLVNCLIINWLFDWLIYWWIG